MGWNNQSWKRFLILPHLLSNFEIQKYYQKKPKFKGIYSWNNLPRTIMDEAFLKYFHEYKSIEPQWIGFRDNGNCVTYLNSFEIEHILKGVKRCICNNNIITKYIQNMGLWPGNVRTSLHWIYRVYV